MKKRSTRSTTIEYDTSSWHMITGNFEAEIYPNTPLLDTNVNLKIPTFAITWNDKEKLMKELAGVLEKYMI